MIVADKAGVRIDYQERESTNDLESIHNAIVLGVRDWSLDRRDARDRLSAILR